jgi:hypothetical protein
MVLPSAKGPLSSMRSISPFHFGHPGTSAHARQIAPGATVVSMLCSVVHINQSNLREDHLCED